MKIVMIKKKGGYFRPYIGHAQCRPLVERTYKMIKSVEDCVKDISLYMSLYFLLLLVNNY